MRPKDKAWMCSRVTHTGRRKGEDGEGQGLCLIRKDTNEEEEEEEEDGPLASLFEALPVNYAGGCGRSGSWDRFIIDER